jgi:hypothetical protein
LESSRVSRVARQQLDRVEVAVHYMEQAAQLLAESGLPVDASLDDAIKRTRDARRSLRAKVSGWVESRRRPKANPSAERCTVFLDECGQHMVTAPDSFPVFVLAAVIIRDVDYPVVDAAWKRWKIENLGKDALVHEPDIRRLRYAFMGQEEAIERLPAILASLDFVAIAVVVHRTDYVADFGTGPIDESLPQHAYLLALDVLTERLALALDRHFDGATAHVVAESRGTKEDAQLQHEFARLHLQGTSYISPAWFRQQLHPGIKFMGKQENNTGLQLADLLARPVGEKVLDPESDPDRWSVFRDKLCPGEETKNSILGLKILPWREKYKDIWKS